MIYQLVFINFEKDTKYFRQDFHSLQVMEEWICTHYPDFTSYEIIVIKGEK